MLPCREQSHLVLVCDSQVVHFRGGRPNPERLHNPVIGLSKQRRILAVEIQTIHSQEPLSLPTHVHHRGAKETIESTAVSVTTEFLRSVAHQADQRTHYRRHN